MINRRRFRAVLSFVLMFILGQFSALAWSNRGHRMINLVAAQSLPDDMPTFMRTTGAIREIAYLGPEPDRWTQRDLEPELALATEPDHYFRLEAAERMGPLPRNRYDFLEKLDDLRRKEPSDASLFTAKEIGTLPWQAEEVFERLEAAFHNYRIAMGEYSPKDYREWAPITKDDLQDIEASAVYYSGWLGHYIGDGCMPLHTSINIAGWMEKKNPQGYTTKGTIHHSFEAIADDAIEKGAITSSSVEALVGPVRQVSDPFADTLAYLQRENRFVEDVYRLDKDGQLTANSPEAQRFIESRMAEGSSMLRDLIYAAWIESGSLTGPKRAAEVMMPAR